MGSWVWIATLVTRTGVEALEQALHPVVPAGEVGLQGAPGDRTDRPSGSSSGTSKKKYCPSRTGMVDTRLPSPTCTVQESRSPSASSSGTTPFQLW